MDFRIEPELEAIRVRIRSFVEEHVLPLEADADAFDDGENLTQEAPRTAPRTGEGSRLAGAPDAARARRNGP